jgi:hypothetical protein
MEDGKERGEDGEGRNKDRGNTLVYGKEMAWMECLKDKGMSLSLLE